jgi:phosphoribosylanthranilate isomerase
MVQVKICCIKSIHEAQLAKRYGAQAIGFVSKMPSGDRWISDDSIRDIATHNTDIKRFLLTCQTDPDKIYKQVCYTTTDTVQLVNDLPLDKLALLRQKLVGHTLVQAIHVNGESAVLQAKSIEPYVDAIILDSGKPSTAVPTFGGTGNTHDWDISAQIVRTVDCPVYLAGGLGADNVAKAIQHVQPYGVDLCSRIRTNGQLDEDLLSEFFAAISHVNS